MKFKTNIYLYYRMNHLELGSGGYEKTENIMSGL